MRMFGTRSILSLTLFVGLGLAAENALAKDVVVVTPSARGRKATKLAKMTRDSIMTKLRERGVSVRAVSGRKAHRVRRCLARYRCARRLVRRLDAEVVLTGNVRRYRGRYVMVLRALDGQSGRRKSSDRARSRRASTVSEQGVRFAMSLVKPPQDSFGSSAPASASLSTVSQVSDTEDPPMK